MALYASFFQPQLQDMVVKVTTEVAEVEATKVPPDDSRKVKIGIARTKWLVRCLLLTNNSSLLDNRGLFTCTRLKNYTSTLEGLVTRAPL